MNKIEKKIKIIREFAKKMGYTTHVEEYENCYNNRPCVSIELCGTHDSEGNPYEWAWYKDTGKEIE